MNQLITAAFFMEGLHDARHDHHFTPNYDVLIEAWGNGCIELVDTLVSHVPLTHKLCDAAAQACDGNYPGVFDYEVSICFGRRFGKHILEHGNEPPTQAVQAWLSKQIETFFAQGLTETEALPIRTAIQDALDTGRMPS